MPEHEPVAETTAEPDPEAEFEVGQDGAAEPEQAPPEEAAADAIEPEEDEDDETPAGPPEAHLVTLKDELRTSGGSLSFSELEEGTGLEPEELLDALTHLREEEGSVREVAPDEFALASDERRDDAEPEAEEEEEAREEYEARAAEEVEPEDAAEAERGAASKGVGGGPLVRALVVVDVSMPLAPGTNDSDIRSWAESIVYQLGHETFEVEGVKAQLLRIEAYDTPRPVFP